MIDLVPEIQAVNMRSGFIPVHSPNPLSRHCGVIEKIRTVSRDEHLAGLFRFNEAVADYLNRTGMEQCFRFFDDYRGSRLAGSWRFEEL